MREPHVHVMGHGTMARGHHTSLDVLWLHAVEKAVSTGAGHTGGAPALRPGAIAQSPGREAGLCWASLPKACPASSVRAREGAGCGSVGAVSGA